MVKIVALLLMLNRVLGAVVTRWDFANAPPSGGKVEGECPGQCFGNLGVTTSVEASDPTYYILRGYFFDTN